MACGECAASNEMALFVQSGHQSRQPNGSQGSAFTRKEAHARSSGHPLIHSLEPGEIWSWCYVDDIAVEVPDVHGDAPLPIAFGG
jgi:hypothetical protein